MGTALIFMLAIPLFMILLAIFVFIPLPMYLGGKIAKVQSEKFTYGSCIWTGISLGIVLGLMEALIAAILNSFLEEGLAANITNIAGLILSIFVVGYFLNKNYLMTKVQIAITYISIIIFNVILYVIYIVFIVSLLSSILGINLFGFNKIETLTKDDNDNNIHSYAINGDNDKVKEYIKNGGDVNSPDEGGSTLLIESSCNPELAKFLLDSGADINAADKIGKETGLMSAIGTYSMNKSFSKNGNEENIKEMEKCKSYIKILIDNGAKLDVKNYFGDTAIDIAKKDHVYDDLKDIFNKTTEQSTPDNVKVPRTN